jgi:phosphoribosylformimino-5-aminoimidazole carboxamide ribotide isomerase
MIVYPAIDIRGGRVVRLMHGNPDVESVYGDDPVTVAARWQNAGAKWLHVVSLDGALGEDTPAVETLQRLSALGLAIQFGGGLRTLDDVEKALEAGASRVILGTLLVNTPEIAHQAVERFGAEAIVAALDAKRGRVATQGWKEVTNWSPIELGKKLVQDGLRYALYTDITRDGALTGVNIPATVDLAVKTDLEVIASGGVSTLQDIVTLKSTRKINGVVIGRALYVGIFTLEDALRVAEDV